jgi:hypothetical protein
VPPRKETHGLAWLVTGLVLAAATAAYLKRDSAKPTPVPSPLSADAAGEEAGVHWFLMLRMPEISAQHESSVDTMKVRIDEWLTALSENGFKPMLFSEATRRIADYQGLPPKTVVLFFNPGYRRTYEIVSPIIARHHFPAVLLSNEAAMKQADRRYLTYHDFRTMEASGQWDTGFADPSGAVRLSGARADAIRVWSPTAGALALNRKNFSQALNFLTLNSDWTSRELIQRLEVEIPAAGPVTLNKALIHGQDWGIAHTESAADSSGFDLRATTSKRGLKLFWLSTLGQPDFRLRTEVRSMIGELWLQLRYDEATTDALDVIISGQSVVAVEERQRKFKRLLNIVQPSPFRGRPFAVDLVLIGRHLIVSVDGQKPQITDQVAAPTPGRGLVQFYQTDRVRGITKADGIRVTYTPLTDTAAAEALFFATNVSSFTAAASTTTSKPSETTPTQ